MNLEALLEQADDNYNQGAEAYKQSDWERAIQFWRKALFNLQAPLCLNIDNLDRERALLSMYLALALDSKGNFEQAINYYQQALNIYQGNFCKSRPDLEPDKAGTMMNLANTLQKIGKLNQAISYYHQTLKIYQGNYCIKHYLELDPDRARTLVNLASAFYNKGDFNQAILYYQQALKGFQSNYCKSQPEVDSERAKAAMNLANTFSNKGYIDQAIDYYQQALKIYQNKYCKNHPDLDPSRALTMMNLAATLRRKDKFEQAISYYEQALKTYQSDFCNNRPELDPNRAVATMNLAIIFEKKDDTAQSIYYYQEALNIYQNDYCVNRPELELDKASTMMYLAGMLKNKGKFEQSIFYYEQAQDLYENPSLGHWLPLNKKRCFLYANYSNLLEEMLDPQIWAKDKSQRLIQLLELAPETGTAKSNEALWQSMREAFTHFHKNWFHYLIQHNHLEDIPLVLFAIQGREVAAEMLDLLDKKAPPEIKHYQQLRRQLRKIITRQGGKASPLDNNDRGFSPSEQTIEAKAQAEYQDLYQKMITARKKASEVEGYELLADTSQFFELAKIQQNPAFQAEQALLIAMKIGEQAGICFIYKDKAPIWFEILGLTELSQAMQKFEISYRFYCEEANRAYRDNQIRAEFEEKIDQSQVLEKPKFDRFWQDLAKKMQELIWTPLAKALQGIHQLYILPQGDLFQIPFNLAAPADLKLSYYPGLIYYGLKKGLIPQKTVEYNTDKIGLLSYAAENNPTHRALPTVAKEINAIQALYQQHHIPIELLNSPDPYPQQPLSLEVLHFSGHGGKDLHRAHSTAFLVGSDKYLGEQDIVMGKARVQHAFMNACILGQVREDSQGTPLSVATGFLRQHTQSLTTAILRINDQLAAIFGEAWHQVWVQSTNKDPVQVLKQALVQFQKDDLTQKLAIIFEEEGELSSDALKLLLQPYLLSEEKQQKIWELADMNDDETETITNIVDHIENLGCFNADYPKQVSADMGVLLYCFRVYGG